MVENLEKMLDRDGKLDEALVRGQQIDDKAQTYRTKAKQVNNVVKKRNCYCWLIIVLSILVAAGLAVLALWLLHII